MSIPNPAGAASPLIAENLDLAYDQRQIVSDLDVSIPDDDRELSIGNAHIEITDDLALVIGQIEVLGDQR